ncbi:MAG: hypothetical protein ABIQ31_01710 [Ferruginibacter sp.]
MIIFIDAIVKKIERGTSYSKVLAVIGGKWLLSETTFRRYWKTANEAHQEAQQAIKEVKAALDIQNALSDRHTQIADVQERKEILTQIAPPIGFSVVKIIISL